MPTRRESASPTDVSSVSSKDGYEALDALTRKQVLEINEAFDAVASGSAQSGHSNDTTQHVNKRRRIEKGKGKAVEVEASQAPGGFLLDDDEDDQTAGGFIRDGDEDDNTGGGGFIRDDTDEDTTTGGGGFIHQSKAVGSSSKTSSNKPKAVLLDEVPSVLESLGLDGDDPSIISIFENAAQKSIEHDGLQAVKRKDFLKVAAILVTQRDEERAQERSYQRSRSSTKGKGKASGTYVASGGGKHRAINIDADEAEDMDEHGDSDPLILDSSEEDEEDDRFNGDNEDSDPWADEDEIDGTFTGSARGTSPPSKRRTTRSRAKKGRRDSSPLSSLPSDDDEDDSKSNPSQRRKQQLSKGKGGAQGGADQGKYRLSSNQREEVNRMFQQFFASNDRGRNKAITMAEIRYVATLLNEKISDEDVIEMLEYASNTRDRSVNLDAFSKIMVDVRAV